MSTVVTSVLVTLGVLAALRLVRAFAFRHHLHRRGRGFVARRFLRRIDATPEQERLFLEELEALRGAVRGVREGVFASRERLAQALEAEALDAQALDALFATALQRLEEARARATQSLSRFHAALAPAQRLQLASMLRSHAGLGAHHHCRS
jgi:uncharacterized membrane protein